MCTNPSTVRRAINGPDDNPPPLPPPPLVYCRIGGKGAAAKIGLGNVAIPCIFECDMDLMVVDDTIQRFSMLLLVFTADWRLAPPALLLASPHPLTPPVAAPAELSGIEVISTVVHSRPLAKKTRLVTDRIYLDMTPSKVRSEEVRSWWVIVDVVIGGDDMTISTAITGWTCELCANDAIWVAVTCGNVDTNGVGITVDDDDNELPPDADVAAMLSIAFIFKYTGTA